MFLAFKYSYSFTESIISVILYPKPLIFMISSIYSFGLYPLGTKYLSLNSGYFWKNLKVNNKS